MRKLHRLLVLAASLLCLPLLLPAQTPAGHHELRGTLGDALPLTPGRVLRFEESEGTWVSLDISPDGKTIVFELLGDLYEMDSRGGTARCIACGLPFDSQPTYSPDGKRLAFISDRSGNENLWIANPDGSSPVRFRRSTTTVS